MTVSASYTDASAKVTVSITSAPANASTVLIERSPDGVTWTTVRGASTLPLTSNAASIDDYEFSDGVTNTYRATYLDATVPTPVGTPAAATAVTSAGASASVNPTLPTGLSVGDVVFVVIANTKATATVPAAPTGWVRLATNTNGLGVYCADWTSSLTAPSFTVTGLASGDKVIGKSPYALRNVGALLGNTGNQVNAAATSIAYPTFTATAGTANAGILVLFSRTVNTGTTPTMSTNDTATGWTLLTDTLIPASIVAGSVALSGSSSATSSTIEVNMPVRAFVSRETGTVSPALSTVWFKHPTRPYLNRAVLVINVDTVTRPSRTSTFAVIGRTLPVAVSDLFGGRTSSVIVQTADPASMDDLENCLLTGETQFVHAPKGSRTPTGYFVFGDLAQSFVASTGTSRRLDIPLTEVAAPSPILAAVIGTWQTVLNDYATWADLIAAKATWADVLLLVGSPSDVVTG